MHQRTNTDARSVHGTTQCLTPFLCIHRNHRRPNPCSSNGTSGPFPTRASITELKLANLYFCLGPRGKLPRMGVAGEMAREEEGEGVRILASGVSSGCSAWCRSGTGATISG
jgi:hypothetical protein